MASAPEAADAPRDVESPPNFFENLPSELGVRIFRLLPQQDLINVARTCRFLCRFVRGVMHRRAAPIILRYMDWIGVCRLPQRPIRKSFPRTQAEYALAHLYLDVYRRTFLEAVAAQAKGIRRCPLLIDLLARKKILAMRYDEFVGRGIIAALRGEACRCESYCARDRCCRARDIDADLVAWCQELDEQQFLGRLRRGDESEQDPLPMLTCCNFEATELPGRPEGSTLGFGDHDSYIALLRDLNELDALSRPPPSAEAAFDYNCSPEAFFRKEAARLALYHHAIDACTTSQNTTGPSAVDFVLATYCSADVLCWGRLRDAGIAFSYYMNRHVGFPTHNTLTNLFPWLRLNACEPRGAVTNAHFWLASSSLRRATPPEADILEQVDVERLAWPMRGRFPLVTYFVGELDSTALATLQALHAEFVRRGLRFDINAAAEGAGSVPLQHATYGLGATKDLTDTVPAIMELVRMGARMPAEVPLPFLRHRCIFPVPDAVVSGFAEILSQRALAAGVPVQTRATFERRVALGPFSAFFIGWLFGEHQKIALARGENSIVRFEYLHLLTSAHPGIFAVPSRDELGYCLAVVSLLSAAYRWGNDASMLMAARELTACGADPLLQVRGRDSFRRISGSQAVREREKFFGDDVATCTKHLLARDQGNVAALSAFYASWRHLTWLVTSAHMVGTPLPGPPPVPTELDEAPQPESFGNASLRATLLRIFEERAVVHAGTEWPLGAFARSLSDKALEQFIDHIDVLVTHFRKASVGHAARELVAAYVADSVREISLRRTKTSWSQAIIDFAASPSPPARTVRAKRVREEPPAESAVVAPTVEDAIGPVLVVEPPSKRARVGRGRGSSRKRAPEQPAGESVETHPTQPARTRTATDKVTQRTRKGRVRKVRAKDKDSATLKSRRGGKYSNKVALMLT